MQFLFQQHCLVIIIVSYVLIFIVCFLAYVVCCVCFWFSISYSPVFFLLVCCSCKSTFYIVWLLRGIQDHLAQT